MFFRRGQGTATGLTPSDNHEGKAMPGDLPFSRYIGEEAAKKLMSDVDLSLGLENGSVAAEIEEIKAEVENVNPRPNKEPEPWPMNPRGVQAAAAQPIPPILPPRQPPVKEEKKRETGGFEVPIQPIPPQPDYKPPQVNVPKAEIPMPKSPLPPIPPVSKPGTMHIPKEKVKIRIPNPPKKKEPTTSDDTDGGSFEKVRNSLTDFVKTLENLNSEIMSKVGALEDAVMKRSKEIKAEAKDAFDDAIDRARKIKDVMHESELKNLEIQEKTMELFNKQEEHMAERERSNQDLYHPPE